MLGTNRFGRPSARRRLLLRTSILALLCVGLAGLCPGPGPGSQEAAQSDKGTGSRATTPSAASWPPPVPVGFDAYVHWAGWPNQRIGVRGYMRSTHDRDGLNRTADASHFLYAERPDFNVALDILGKGVLYFVRTNRWHGSPWHYEVDGVEHLVTETSTADPNRPALDPRLEPAEAFPPPLALTWPTTKGSDLSWLPVAFARSLRLAYGRTFYGTGYFIYHQVVEGALLSSAPEPFDLRAPPSEPLDVLSRAGSDIAPRDIPHESAELMLNPGRPARVFQLDGPATVRALKFTVPRDRALDLSQARLVVTWDGRPAPSIDAPLGLFFGAGLLYNRSGAEYLVKSFPVTIRYSADTVHLAAYFPMPFFRSATIEIVPPAGLGRPVPITAELRHEPLSDRPSTIGYLHATYRDQGVGEPGRDHVLLDTRGIEGSEHWSGSFIGTSFTFTDTAEFRTLEGDPRFFFDDARSPQAHGTGTEEWAGGGDYWGGQTTTLPFVGHPIGSPTPAEARDENDLVHSAYRFLLADLFPFGKNARIQLEHGGANDVFERYRTVAYWYGLPAASLERTDVLMLGDAASEREHRYRSPNASAPALLTSRYDLGPDTYRTPARDPAAGQRGGESASAPAGELIPIYPEESQRVRYSRGTSEFRLAIDPDNAGVMLRRTLDYGIPNQRAEVFLADGDALEPVWEFAGHWYTAGSNVFYHSFPADELAPSTPVVHVSNRRFLEDEFLLPLGLTKGRRSLRIRVAFDPVDRPLLPGLAVSPTAWSEIRYDAYCWIEPRFALP